MFFTESWQTFPRYGRSGSTLSFARESRVRGWNFQPAVSPCTFERLQSFTRGKNSSRSVAETTWAKRIRFGPGSVSRHYPLPANVRIQWRRNACRSPGAPRDYEIALPSPREVFNLVYYRPATFPPFVSAANFVSVPFRLRKLLDEFLFNRAASNSEGKKWPRLPVFPSIDRGAWKLARKWFLRLWSLEEKKRGPREAWSSKTDCFVYTFPIFREILRCWRYIQKVFPRQLFF